MFAKLLPGLASAPGAGGSGRWERVCSTAWDTLAQARQGRGRVGKVLRRIKRVGWLRRSNSWFGSSTDLLVEPTLPEEEGPGGSPCPCPCSEGSEIPPVEALSYFIKYFAVCRGRGTDWQDDIDLPARTFRGMWENLISLHTPMWRLLRRDQRVLRQVDCRQVTGCLGSLRRNWSFPSRPGRPPGNKGLSSHISSGAFSVFFPAAGMRRHCRCRSPAPLPGAPHGCPSPASAPSSPSSPSWGGGGSDCQQGTSRCTQTQGEVPRTRARFGAPDAAQVWCQTSEESTSAQGLTSQRRFPVNEGGGVPDAG